jgi:nucleotide-binding universal stress UspA family protein
MRILACYDGVNDPKKVMAVAKLHAKALNAQLDILTATGHSPEIHQQKIRVLEEELELYKKEMEDEGIKCETHLLVRSLSPGEDLVEFAKENDIDEVVIGVKQRSKIGKLIMGSTAQYVILSAPCPVTSVK